MVRPIQRAIFSGSVQNANTVSRRASIRISRSMTPSTATVAPSIGFLLFRGASEARQAVIPEVLEPGTDFRGSTGACPIHASRAGSPFRDQTRIPEHGEVLRDRRPGDVEPRGNLAGGQLALTDEGEDLAPAWVGDRAKGNVHVGGR